MSPGTQSVRLFGLRVFLAVSALGWGVCLAGVFLPGETAFGLLTFLADVDPAPLERDPTFEYWLRMASGAFALIGWGYLGLAACPKRFVAVLPFAGMFMIAEGAVLLTHGLRLGLQPVPFLGDTVFCLAGGTGILLCMSSARS